MTMMEVLSDPSCLSLQVFSPALNEDVVQARDPLTAETGLSNSRKVSEKGGGASLKESVCQVNDLWVSVWRIMSAPNAFNVIEKL